MSTERHQCRNSECNQSKFLHIHHIDLVFGLENLRSRLVSGNYAAFEVPRICRQEISNEHWDHGKSVS